MYACTARVADPGGFDPDPTFLRKKNTTGPNLQGKPDPIIIKHPESYLILHHKIHPVLFSFCIKVKMIYTLMRYYNFALSPMGCLQTHTSKYSGRG